MPRNMMQEIYSMLSARGCQVDSNSNDCIGIVQQYIITVELATQKLCMNGYVSLHHVFVAQSCVTII